MVYIKYKYCFGLKLTLREVLNRPLWICQDGEATYLECILHSKGGIFKNTFLLSLFPRCVALKMPVFENITKISFLVYFY